MKSVLFLLLTVAVCSADTPNKNFFCDLTVAPGQFEIHLAESWHKDGLRAMSVLQRKEAIYVYNDAIITRADVHSARHIADEYGRPALEVLLTDSGFKKLAAATTAHLHKQVAIIVDGTVVCDPVIDTPLSKPALTITGYLSETETYNLAACINRK